MGEALLQEWANSLVGRDWEIYWKPEEEEQQQQQQQIHDDESPTTNTVAVVPQEQTLMNEHHNDDNTANNNNNKDDEEMEEEEEEEHVEDWYDAHIAAIERVTENGKYSFQVRFVGDETIYNMVLEPTWVRPAVRAWVNRSKAILSSSWSTTSQTSQSTTTTTNTNGGQQQQQHAFVSEWEKSLPLDTRTIDDRDTLAQMEAQHVQSIGNDADHNNDDATQQSFTHPHHQHHSKEAQKLPSQDEVRQIQRLSYLLNSQIYLRSKLAPIVELPDEGGISEVYVDHLLQCLTYVEKACRWYLRCWDLHKCIFSAPILSSTDIPTKSANLDEDYAIKEGLQQGRHVVIQLLKVDTSLAGAKRRRATTDQHSSPGGTRKTKRRRKNKSFQEMIKESERGGGEQPSPEEDEFLASEVVNDFVDQIKSHDNRWYLECFGKMLQSLSLNIVAPSLLWRYRVEALLGDRPDSEVDDGHSDGATSEEDNDDDVDNKADHVAVEGVSADHQQPVASSSTEGKRCYTYDEIKSFEESANYDQVLRQFNLSRWQSRLRQKLSDVEHFETHTWGVLSQLFSKPTTPGDAKQMDEIYSELLKLRASATTLGSPVGNVNPIGRSMSVLTRKVLDDSIAIRSWYLDLHRVEVSKERLVFVEKVTARASDLPRIPPCEHSITLDALFDEAVARLKTISQRYFDHLSRFNKYRSLLLARNNDGYDDGLDFLTMEGVSRALRELGDIRVLSVAEEMLSVRLDVLSWKREAENLLSNQQVPFDGLVSIQKSLDSILRGRSPARVRMLASIEPNDQVDEEIRAFAEADVSTLCGSVTSMVTSKYSITQSWKERADSIISALEQHNSGQQHSSQKPPPMIDLKRINSLLAEYNSLRIFLPEHYTFLVQECTKANLWSIEITNALSDKAKPFSALVSYLQTKKTNRPPGIIVDPARHVVDNLLDVLQWHQQVYETRKQSTECLNLQGSSAGVDLSNVKDTTSSTSKSLYALISEGSEILELFTARKESIRFVVSSAGALALIAKQLDSRRPMRVISRAKLDSNPLGSVILERLICEDDREGSPLSFLVFLLWRISVLDFIKKYESRRGSKEGVTLKEAQALALQKPISKPPGSPASTADILADAEDTNSNWGYSYSSEEKQLIELLQAGEEKEREATKAIATAKELFRGPSRHEESIREHLVIVKELQNEIKMLRNEGNGLVLSQKLETQLDLTLKALSWVVRTFPYPFLHKVHCTIMPENRISWDALVQLNERKPSGLENMGDCAGIALRAADLYESAKAWQKEISKVTMLSNRGGKRRGETGSGEQDGGTQSTVNVETVHRLAKDPILTKVDMPREDAVTEILERAKAFETHLHKFLGEDYDGAYSDRAPYPEASSLIGGSGEFLLYRLTGSPLYGSLLSSMELIASSARDVLADTPGKVAFEWIRQAVSWIESLHAAVTRKTYNAGSSDVERLVINENDAREILDNGRSFFLDIPEDLRKTLSTHMIYVSTNKIEEKFTVIFKKGGAHHSIGGTAIRWCPLLFDSLREDLNRLEEWKSQVQTIQDDFGAFSTERNGIFNDNDEDLCRLHSFHEETLMLFEEGVETLAVAPPKQVVDTLSDFLESMDKHIQNNSDNSSIEKIRKKRFEDPVTVMGDRSELLDSLLSRGAILFERDEFDAPTLHTLETFDNSFRDTCRLYLEKALRKGLQMMGLQQDDPEFRDLAFCTSKAWEIEFEMYNRFQAYYGESMISPEYRDKARMLRWGLEDGVSPKLCIQVLLGEIDPADLVSMSEEQIVGDHEHHNDADAEADDIVDQAVASEGGLVSENGNKASAVVAESNNNEDIEMNTVAERASNSEASKTNGENGVRAAPEPSMTPQPVVLPSSLPLIESVKNENVVSESSVAATGAEASLPQPVISAAPNEESSTKDVPSNGDAENKDSIYEDLDFKPAVAATALSSPVAKEEKTEEQDPKMEAVSDRPDAPPSLAASVGFGGKHASKKKNSGKPTKRGKFVTNTDGEDVFLITVCKPTVKFTARFYLDNEAQASICGILPESIVEKGRLRVDEFSKFLSGKLKGGRWVAIPMRLSVYSEEDAKKHKKFYKDYETMKRIAMFSIGDNTKMFLVTPKFHRAAAKAMSTSFSVETSTYAIVLTREKLPKTRY